MARIAEDLGLLLLDNASARPALDRTSHERVPSAALLHTVDGLSAVLSLNERAWEWALSRAGDIASGSLVHEAGLGMAEVNLAVTTTAIRPVLAPRDGAS
ncbi:MAG TPA: hypothetical protein VMB04_10310 [Mycobacterium sp.]|nr:hypothetical protein [Mycobacterium sp.]